MAVHIENSFVVPVELDAAWTLLTDVPYIAPNIPGAEITEVVDASTYRGSMRIKIGPVQLVFSGEAQLCDVDAALRSARMRAHAADTKGRGNANVDIAFALAAEGEATRVNITTELTLSGNIAQYGRGAGLMREVANQFIAQFARNLEQSIIARAAAGVDAPADNAGPAKPVSGLGLAYGASRTLVGNWLSGAKPAGAKPKDKS
jgi:carbon monoxide dehydrogenase subunit G